LSLTSQTFEDALREIMASPNGDKLSAIHVLQREHARWKAEHNHLAWADGRRGEAVAKIPGLTDTLTSLLRRFAACGIVRYEDFGDLHRHVSALRKKLKDMAPGVQIETLIGEGYEIVAGFDQVYRMLHAGKAPSLRIGTFTVKQSMILRLLAQRGSVHVEQTPCLQRHMSNIRAKLKAMGLSRQITIRTEAGEGLYVLERGRDALHRLIAGEIEAKPKPAKAATPKPPRLPRNSNPPKLSLVAA
jgi:DNA-binding winged helix-turn-helix (wHTH) protein